MLRLARPCVGSEPHSLSRQDPHRVLQCSAIVILMFGMFGAALLTGCRTNPRPAGSGDWDKYVADYLESYFAAHPDVAVAEGRHEFDGQLPDWTRAGIDGEIARLHAARARAAAFAGNLDQRQQFERDYVLAQLIRTCSGANQPAGLIAIPTSTAIRSIPRSI